MLRFLLQRHQARSTCAWRELPLRDSFDLRLIYAGHRASAAAAAAEGRAAKVTHDPEFIRTCCTDFARMEDGSFVDQGVLDNAGWFVLSFLRMLFEEAKGTGDTMDIADAPMRGATSVTTREAPSGGQRELVRAS